GARRLARSLAHDSILVRKVRALRAALGSRGARTIGWGDHHGLSRRSPRRRSHRQARAGGRIGARPAGDRRRRDEVRRAGVRELLRVPSREAERGASSTRDHVATLYRLCRTGGASVPVVEAARRSARMTAMRGALAVVCIVALSFWPR